MNKLKSNMRYVHKHNLEKKKRDKNVKGVTLSEIF